MLQKNSIKNLIRILNSIKRKKKIKNLFYNKYFTFYKYYNSKYFAAKCSIDSKQNDLEEFKNILESFYHDTIENKPTNENLTKDLERKVVLGTASKLHDKLLNIYATR